MEDYSEMPDGPGDLVLPDDAPTQPQEGSPRLTHYDDSQEDPGSPRPDFATEDTSDKQFISDITDIFGSDDDEDALAESIEGGLRQDEEMQREKELTPQKRISKKSSGDTDSPKRSAKSPKKRKRTQDEAAELPDAEYNDDLDYETARNMVTAEESDRARYDALDAELDEELSSIRASMKPRNRRRKATEEVVAAYNDEIATLAERMNDAYVDDKKANDAGKMAISKLRMLDEVVSMLHRRNPGNDIQLDQEDLDRPVINSGFLRACRNWLLPLPDGSLPSLKIRESILKNLHKLEVDSQVLIDSKIGIAVMTLSKHKSETVALKKVCKGLISKWSRPIFGVTSDYGALKVIEPRLAPEPSPKRPRLNNQSSSNLDSMFDGNSLRKSQDSPASGPWYPKRGFDGLRRPGNNTTRNKDGDLDDAERRPQDTGTAKLIKDRMAGLKKSKSVGDVRAFSVRLNALPRAHERK